MRGKDMNRLSIILLRGFLGVMLLCINSPCQTERPHIVPTLTLDHPVEYFETKDVPITNVLTRDRDGYNWWKGRMSTGIVYPQSPNQMKLFSPPYPNNISVKIASTTIRGVLDALTAADTNYFWLFNNGAIDLIPKQVSEGLVSPTKLEEVIPSFNITKVNIWEAVAALVEQARAQGIKQFDGMPKPQSSHETEGWFSEEEKITLSLKNKTIRQCLDSIVLADHPSGWWAVPSKEFIYVMANAGHSHGFKHRQLSKEELEELKKKYPLPYPKGTRIRGSEHFGPPKEQEFGDPLTPEIKKQVERYYREKEKSKQP